MQLIDWDHTRIPIGQRQALVATQAGGLLDSFRPARTLADSILEGSAVSILEWLKAADDAELAISSITLAAVSHSERWRAEDLLNKAKSVYSICNESEVTRKPAPSATATAPVKDNPAAPAPRRRQARKKVTRKK